MAETTTLEYYQGLLATAREALSSADGVVTFSTGEQSYSFQGPDQLLAYVERLERKISQLEGTYRPPSRFSLSELQP